MKGGKKCGVLITRRWKSDEIGVKVNIREIGILMLVAQVEF
jgi:hypothetical protein